MGDKDATDGKAVFLQIALRAFEQIKDSRDILFAADTSSQCKEGGCGSVNLYSKPDSGEKFAIKQVKFSSNNLTDDVEALKCEIDFHLQLEHANILKTYVPVTTTISGIQVLAHVLEYGQEFKDAKAEEKLEMFSGIFSGLEYLKTEGIVHSDMKEDNVFYVVEGDKNVAKIADFGLSMYEADYKEQNSVGGTPDYVPMDQLEQGKRSYPVDMWAAGIMLYNTWYGQPQYALEMQKEPYGVKGIRILREKKKCPGNLDRINKSDCKKLVQRLLEVDAATRIEAKDAKIHNCVHKQEA